MNRGSDDIRELTPEDLAAVHDIEVAVSPDPWGAGLFADELAQGRTDRHWLVAVADGAVVGFGGLLFVADEAHIMNLAVSPDRQRQGIATGLVANLLSAAGDRGAIAATLEVRASNAAAAGLYRSFGFTESGRRPRYYPDGEDAIIMWVHRIHRAQYRRMLERRAMAEIPTGGPGVG